MYGENGLENKVRFIVDGIPYHYQIKLETSSEAKQKHPTMNLDSVYVTSSSLVTLAKFQSFLYAIIHHPLYVHLP